METIVSNPNEIVAWRTFDGEGGFDLRNYQNNENYLAAWAARSPHHRGLVEALGVLPLPTSRWPAIHLKTGNRYDVTGECILEASAPVAPEAVLIEFLRDGMYFVCEQSEFLARLTQLAACAQPGTPAGQCIQVLGTRIHATNGPVAPGALLVSYTRGGKQFSREAHEFMDKFAAESSVVQV